MKIRYRPAAVAQIDGIFAKIVAQNPDAALRVVGTIRKSIDRFADFPYSARASEITGIRELPIVRYPDIVFFAVDDEAREVHILRVRHTSQNPAHHLD